jgi:hypothetical protein
VKFERIEVGFLDMHSGPVSEVVVDAAKTECTRATVRDGPVQEVMRLHATLVGGVRVKVDDELTLRLQDPAPEVLDRVLKEEREKRSHDSGED